MNRHRLYFVGWLLLSSAAIGEELAVEINTTSNDPGQAAENFIQICRQLRDHSPELIDQVVVRSSAVEAGGAQMRVEGRCPPPLESLPPGERDDQLYLEDHQSRVKS